MSTRRGLLTGADTPEGKRIARQLRAVAGKIRVSMTENPDAVDEREALWIEHFNLLRDLEALG